MSFRLDRLYIAEESSVGRAVAQTLGIMSGGVSSDTGRKGYIRVGNDIVTWARGHLLEAAEPEDYHAKYKRWSLDDLPIWPDDWKLVESKKKGAENQLKLIGQLLADRPKEVVHVGDPDREGQLIVDELLLHFKWTGPTKRLHVQAVAPEAIKKDLASLKDNKVYENLSAAAECRRRADWAVGMNLTRAATKALSGDPNLVLSVGRVQTPTLALVVKRDLEVEGSVAQHYFILKIKVENQQKETLELVYSPPESERIFSAQEANALAQGIKGLTGPLIRKYQVKTESPPKLFTLPTLQRLANQKWKWSLKKTLEVASSLYLKGVLTYPRTECPYLRDEQKEYLGKTLEAIAKLSELSLLAASASKTPIFRKSVYDSSKVEEHHALIPTVKKIDLSAVTEDEIKIYEAVSRRFIASILPDREYGSSEYSFFAKDLKFIQNYSATITQGWRVVEPLEKEDLLVPDLQNGEKVTVTSSEYEKKKVKPPAYFTEGTLQEAMESVSKLIEDSALRKFLQNSESRGLGTAATQHTIIEVLKDRGYLSVHGTSLKSTLLGRKLIQALPPELCNPRLTALWEQDLDGVAKGIIKPELFMKRTRNTIERHLEDIIKKGGSDIVKNDAPKNTRN